MKSDSFYNFFAGFFVSEEKIKNKLKNKIFIFSILQKSFRRSVNLKIKNKFIFCCNASIKRRRVFKLQ